MSPPSPELSKEEEERIAFAQDFAEVDTNKKWTAPTSDYLDELITACDPITSILAEYQQEEAIRGGMRHHDGESAGHPLDLQTYIDIEQGRVEHSLGDAKGEGEEGEEGKEAATEEEQERNQIYHKMLFDAVNENLVAMLPFGGGPPPPPWFRHTHAPNRYARRFKLEDVARAQQVQRESMASGHSRSARGAENAAATLDQKVFGAPNVLRGRLMDAVGRWDKLEEDPRDTRATIRSRGDNTMTPGDLPAHPLTPGERMEAVVRAEMQQEEAEWLDWQSEEASIVEELERQLLEGLLTDTALVVQRVMEGKKAKRQAKQAKQAKRAAEAAVAEAAVVEAGDEAGVAKSSGGD